MVKLLENATKVSLTGDTCDDCQSAIVDVHFKVSLIILLNSRFSLSLCTGRTNWFGQHQCCVFVCVCVTLLPSGSVLDL